MSPDGVPLYAGWLSLSGRISSVRAGLEMVGKGLNWEWHRVGKRYWRVNNPPTITLLLLHTHTHLVPTNMQLVDWGFTEENSHAGIKNSAQKKLLLQSSTPTAFRQVYCLSWKVYNLRFSVKN